MTANSERSDGKLLLTIDEAASSLSIGRSHVYRFVLTGELRSVKIGRSRRVPRDALDEFVKGLQEEEALQ
jgi:excisionase family DNA binding protein